MSTALEQERTPRVCQARRRILEAIAKGRYEPGSLLPVQQVWSRKVGVSPFVVRLALEPLKRRGIIRSRRGSGMVLCRQPSEEEIRSLLFDSPRVQLDLWLPEPQGPRKLGQAMVRHAFQRLFQQQYPHVRFVEHLLPPDGGQVEIESICGLLAGRGPTVGEAHQTALGLLASREVIQPFRLSQSQDYFDQLHPRYLAACRSPGEGGDGSPLLLPIHASFSFLSYNKRLLHRARVDATRLPRDWDELLDVARRLAKSQDGQPSLWFSSWEDAAWWLSHLIYQADDLPAVSRGSSPPRLSEIDWNRASAKEGLAFFHRLFCRERLAAVYEGIPTLFSAACLSDRVPIFLSPGLAGEMVWMGEGERFAIAPLPTGPNGRLLSQLNVIGVFVAAGLEGEKRELAERFLVERERWLHLGPGGEELRSQGVKSGLFSLLRKPEEDRYCLTDLPSDWLKVFDQLYDSAMLESYGADWRRNLLGESLASMHRASRMDDLDELQQYCRLHDRLEGIGISNDAEPQADG